MDTDFALQDERNSRNRWHNKVKALPTTETVHSDVLCAFPLYVNANFAKTKNQKEVFKIQAN